MLIARETRESVSASVAFKELGSSREGRKKKRNPTVAMFAGQRMRR
jgi:hypothetical protein